MMITNSFIQFFLFLKSNVCWPTWHKTRIMTLYRLVCLREVSKHAFRNVHSFIVQIKLCTWSICATSSKCLKYWLACLFPLWAVCRVSTKSVCLLFSHWSQNKQTPYRFTTILNIDIWRASTSHHYTNSLRANVPVSMTKGVILSLHALHWWFNINSLYYRWALRKGEEKSKLEEGMKQRIRRKRKTLNNEEK